MLASTVIGKRLVRFHWALVIIRKPRRTVSGVMEASPCGVGRAREACTPAACCQFRICSHLESNCLLTSAETALSYGYEHASARNMERLK